MGKNTVQDKQKNMLFACGFIRNPSNNSFLSHKVAKKIIFKTAGNPTRCGWWIDLLLENLLGPVRSPISLEDPEVNIKSWGLKRSQNIFCVCRGGDNILSYLTQNPGMVYAAEDDFYQYCMIKLKISAFKNLPNYQAVLNFLSGANCSDSTYLYKKYIHDDLERDVALFWNKPRQQKMLKRGIYKNGLLRPLFSYLLFLMGIKRSEVMQRFQRSSLANLDEWLDKKLNNIFAKKYVLLLTELIGKFNGFGLSRYGFACLKEYAKDNQLTFPDVCKKLLKDFLLGFNLPNNYFLSLCVNNHYQDPNSNEYLQNTEEEISSEIPLFLQEKYYETVKKNLDKINLYYDAPQNVLLNLPPKSIHCFSFLNIQDHMKTKDILNLWQSINRAASEHSSVVFKTTSPQDIVQQRLGEDGSQTLLTWKSCTKRALEILAKDRCRIYSGLHIYNKQATQVPLKGISL